MVDRADVTSQGDVAPSLRAQLLATEHWSLLASRSTTQNEVLVRIAIYLTLVSASVVSLALIGQATDFDGRFDAFTIVLFSILLLVGTLTLFRVLNGGEEDLAYVIGMNRIRAGYAELDSSIERYFVTSTNDDQRGITQTDRNSVRDRRGELLRRMHVSFRSPLNALAARIRGVVSA